MIESPPKSKRGGKRKGAGRKPNTQSDDIAALIEALRPVRVGRQNYTALDRYREARLTFSSEAGKRILSQIVDLCEGKVLFEHEVESVGKLAYRAGMRFVGIQIMAWMNQPREAADSGKKG